MPIRSIAALALVAVTAPSLAQTDADDSQIYLSPLATRAWADDVRGIDDATGFMLAAGMVAHRRWNLEIDLFRGRFDGAGGDDVTIDAAGLSVLHVFRREARVTPYLLVGAGAQRKDNVLGGRSTDAYGDLGAGLLVGLHASAASGTALSLRLDARARYDDFTGESRRDHLLGLGIQFAFGGESTRETAPVEVPPPPVVPPPDEDGDGVADDDDRCPGTPAGAPVGADGCELDGDEDGVPDRADRCPNTPLATRVDARGCTLQQEIRLPAVTFEYDSDRLRPDAFESLDEAIATLRRNPDLAIEVQGHTDDRGPDDYNLALSQRRAEAVLRYLVENGARNAMTARGYGERRPIADNDTEAGRAQNRRVVLRILAE